MISHYTVIVSTENGTSIQTAANLAHVNIFCENALNELNPGRIILVVEPVEDDS